MTFKFDYLVNTVVGLTVMNKKHKIKLMWLIKPVLYQVAVTKKTGKHLLYAPIKHINYLRD